MVTITNKKSDIANIIDIKNVIIGEYFDEGGESQVFKGKYNNKNVIIKQYKSTDNNYKVEINAYNLLYHKYMVQCYGYFVDEEGFNNLVLEEAQGIILSDLASLEEGEEYYINYYEKLCIAYQICEFLEYLRINHVIHRDLKTDNIMVDVKPNENRLNNSTNNIYNINDLKLIVPIKLLDFGIVKIAENTYTTTFSQGRNTVNYTSPEFYDIENNKTVDNYNTKLISYKVDIWAFGCVLSYLFSGIIPWENIAKNHFVIQTKMIYKHKFPIPKDIDVRIKPLVELCTNINPKERPNPSTLLKLIEALYLDKALDDEIKLLSPNNYI